MLLALALVLAAAPPSGAQERKRAGERSAVTTLYRRPLGNDPATLDPARILGIHRNSLKTMLTRWDLGNRADD